MCEDCQLARPDSSKLIYIFISSLGKRSVNMQSPKVDTICAASLIRLMRCLTHRHPPSRVFKCTF